MEGNGTIKEKVTFLKSFFLRSKKIRISDNEVFSWVWAVDIRLP